MVRHQMLAICAALVTAGTACNRATPATTATPAHEAHQEHAHHAHERPPEPPAAPHAAYTRADVQFMHHMIMHHAQALVMSELVPERTTRVDLRLLAERITVSQRDEIEQMERWLRSRGEEVPTDPGHGAAHGHAAGAAMGHSHMMPGMLTEQEIAQLAAARGQAFDTLFLEYMIRHHEGALVMVRELFDNPEAGQETEIFRFASDAYADQQAEIARMRALLTPR